MLSRDAESFARVVVRAGGMVMPATHSVDGVGGGGVTGVTTLHYHLASMAAGGRSSGGGATPDGDVLAPWLRRHLASTGEAQGSPTRGGAVLGRMKALPLSEQIASMNRL